MAREQAVHVNHPEFGLVTIGPNDELPEWAREFLHERHFEDGGIEAGGGIPPRSGAGSGAEAWAAYAASLGVDVPADAKRDEIIAAIADADHPVE